jgi:nitrite reductase/ring-hydroxylating ferredoxin subunit
VIKIKQICNINELTEGKGKRFIIDDLEIALFLLNGKVYALSNICPHLHASIIHDGFLENGFVVCPAHGWKFNLSDGKNESGFNGLISFPVKIENSLVYVDLSVKSLKW